MSEQRKAVIKNADMVESMQQDAVDIASKALSEYNIEKVSSAPLRMQTNQWQWNANYLSSGCIGVYQEGV